MLSSLLLQKCTRLFLPSVLRECRCAASPRLSFKPVHHFVFLPEILYDICCWNRQSKMKIMFKTYIWLKGLALADLFDKSSCIQKSTNAILHWAITLQPSASLLSGYARAITHAVRAVGSLLERSLKFMFTRCWLPPWTKHRPGIQTLLRLPFSHILLPASCPSPHVWALVSREPFSSIWRSCVRLRPGGTTYKQPTLDPKSSTLNSICVGRSGKISPPISVVQDLPVILHSVIYRCFYRTTLASQAESDNPSLQSQLGRCPNKFSQEQQLAIAHRIPG